jgi:hypothetical protein
MTRYFCGRNYRPTHKWQAWLLRLIPYDAIRVIVSEKSTQVYVNGVLEWPR